MADRLQKLLCDLVQEAEQQPGRVQMRFLVRGLQLEVKQESNQIFLRMSRSGEKPSPREWEAVIHHWPYPVADAGYREFWANNRGYLSGQWPVQPRLL